LTTLKETTVPERPVVRLRRPVESRSLWVDALIRLRRNRAAVLGVIVLVLTVVIAVFAPVFAPKNYDAAVLADNNAAPDWISARIPDHDCARSGRLRHDQQQLPPRGGQTRA